MICRYVIDIQWKLRVLFACVYAAKGKGSGGVKTAKLYAWVALQTLPEEMVISPCLLDFLEKALETIPITPVERNYTGVFYAIQISVFCISIFSLVFRTKYLCCLLLSIGFPRGWHGSVWCRTAGGIHHFSGVLLNISLLLLSRGCGCLCQSSGILHSSIVKPSGYNGSCCGSILKPANFSRSGFRFSLFCFSQPSQIRFSCLPMSRVECMLKLPSLDLVFSSNRGERENPAGAHPSDGSHPASSTPPGQHIPKTLPSKGLQNCAVDAKILIMQLCSLSKLKHVLTNSLLCSSACLCAILCSALVEVFDLALFTVNVLLTLINEFLTGFSCIWMNSYQSDWPLLSFLPASPLLGSPLSRSRHSSSQSDLTGPPSASSGLSFTACMSDFSLYVFHPYGAGKQKSAVTGLPPGSGPLGMERGKQTLVVVVDYSK